jgi:ATP-binding cassette, subfamily C (CFTR/MRP), member 1
MPQQILAATSVISHTALLACWIKSPLTNYSIAAAILALISAVGAVLLVSVEHTRTVRPSTLLTVYLVIEILVGLINVRTIHLRYYLPLLERFIFATLIIKFTLLVLESWQKQRIIQLGTDYSPEETSGILNHSVLWWLNPLFFKGYRNIISQEDLYGLDGELRSTELRDQILECWEMSE